MTVADWHYNEGGKILSVYLDVLLFENFLVNYFLMTITAQSIKYCPKRGVTALASFIGCLYVIVPLYSNFRIFSLFPFKIGVAILMTFITLGKQEILFIAKATAVFVLYSMMLAGLCLFLQFNSLGVLHSTAIIYNFSYKTLLIALMVMYLVLLRIVTYVRDRRHIMNFIYNVDIQFGKYSKSVRALLDTGNELREPATNLPVLIVESNVLSAVNLDKFDRLYLPYKSVNGDYGMIIGIKPPYIEIQVGKEKERREVIIGLCPNKLSSCGDYEALLSRGII